jgi:hypothetical protein
MSYAEHFYCEYRSNNLFDTLNSSIITIEVTKHAVHFRYHVIFGFQMKVILTSYGIILINF